MSGIHVHVALLQTRLWKYDYAGITVLIVTSFIPPIFYGFLCHLKLRNFYLYSTLLLGKRMLMTQLIRIAVSFLMLHGACAS